MSLFKEFSSLFPYLQSIRRLEDYLSFDVSFPKTWKLPKKYVPEDRVLEQESKIPNNRLFSFVSNIDETSIETTSNNITNIINYNLEREEKERLFTSKVDELKLLFEKNSLKNLKTLTFEIKPNKIELTDNEEEVKTTSLVAEAD
jgi:hypothetical protein